MSMVSVWAGKSGRDYAAPLKAVLQDLQGLDGIVLPGDSVVLFPDLLLPEAEMGVNTAPALVAAMAAEAVAAGAHKVTVAVQSLPGFAFDELLQKSGYAAMLQAAGLEIVDLREAEAANYACMSALVAPSYPVYRLLQDADVLISLPKLKIGDGLLFGGALPQLSRAVPDFAARYDGFTERAMADLTSLIAPALTVVDCSRGQAGYQPLATDGLVAGFDAAAVDMVLATAGGLPIEGLTAVQLAKQYGRTTASPQDIHIIGADLRKLMKTPPAAAAPALDDKRILH